MANNAAIPDADEVKAFIPEFDGGIGAGAVHEKVELLARTELNDGSGSEHYCSESCIVTKVFAS